MFEVGSSTFEVQISCSLLFCPWSLDIPCMPAVALAEVGWILDIRNPFLILYSAVSDRGYNDLADYRSPITAY